MTETSTTITKTAPLAIYAVAQHLLDHRLPAPLFINGPTSCNTVISIGVPSFPASALTEWLDSIVVDTETASPMGHGTGRERVTYSGRLLAAIGEVRVDLMTVRKIVRPLVSIDGGAA